MERMSYHDRFWPAAADPKPFVATMTLPSRTETKAKPFGQPAGDHNIGHREEKW